MTATDTEALAEAASASTTKSSKKKSCNEALGCSICGYTFGLIFLGGVGAAFVALGAIHTDNCPVEPEIPTLSMGT